MNAPFDFEAWGDELSPERFEFGNMEMELETELGRRRRARGPARRGTVRPPPPARSLRTPRSPLLQLRPRFPFRPRPPARPVFPVILPAWARGSLSRHLCNRLLPNRPRRHRVDSRVADLRRRSLRMPNQPLLSQRPPSRRSR